MFLIKSCRVYSWSGYECGQSANKLQGAHNDMCPAIIIVGTLQNVSGSAFEKRVPALLLLRVNVVE